MSNPSITLEALSVLDTIDKRGSFAAAAEELNKVPSALSYIVQKLEEQLDVTLFQRQGRKSVLTPAGKHLLNEGRQILSATAALAERTQSIARGWEPKIRIAIDSMFNIESTYDIFHEFLDQHPNIEIDISEEVMRGGWEALIEDRVDLLLGAAGPVPQQQGLQAVSVAQLDLVFCASPKHPLTKELQPIENARIAEERTVVVHDSARTSIPWTKGIIAESRYFYVPTVDCKIRAQLAGIGCGYLPRKRIQRYLDSQQLIELDIATHTKSSISDMYIAWKTVNHGKGIQTLRSMFIDKLKTD